jgi:capsular polysaccharide biosynthesis protein
MRLLNKVPLGIIHKALTKRNGMLSLLQNRDPNQEESHKNGSKKTFIPSFQQTPKPHEKEELTHHYDIQKLKTGIARHRSLILLMALLFGLIGLAIAYSYVTTYEATSTVIFQEDRGITLPGGNSISTLSMPTVLDMIKSPGNFAAVKKVLALEESAAAISSMVEVVNAKNNSKFIHIEVKSKNPFLAVDIANSLAKTAIKSSQDFNLRQLLQALESYKAILANVHVRYNSQLKDIEEFKLKNRSLEMTADLSHFTTQALTTRERLEEATLRYRSLQIQYENLSAAIASLPNEVPFQNKLNSPIHSRILSLQAALSDARLRYAKENPKLKSLENQLAELQIEAKKIQEEGASTEEMVANPLKEQLNIELMRLAGSMLSAEQVKEDLQLSYDKLEKELENIPGKQMAFGKLLYARDLTQQEIKFLTDAVESINLMINWPRGSIELYELAEKATRMATPLAALFMVLGALLLGTLLGTVFAIFKELRDDKFRTSKEVELVYSVPCIATIPQIEGLKKENADKKTLFFIRTIGERLEIIRSEKGIKDCPVVGIGSSLNGEGKTLISNMLASYYGILERKVLLINADPHKSEDFNTLRTKKTLENYLRNPTDVNDLIIEGDVDKISVGSSKDPLMKELLKTSVLLDLWNTLKNRYSMIFIDIPSVIDNDSAVNLFALANIRLFIIDSSKVSRKIVDESMDQLEQQHLSIQGIILNDVLPLFIKDQRTLNEIKRNKVPLWKRLLLGKAN